MMLRSNRPRAFASFAAIAMIAVVGFALLALSATFASQVRRTQAARTDAQLRQLLLAGAAHAQAALATPDVPLRLQTPLSEAAVTLTVFREDRADAEVTVLATLDDAAARQTLRFTRADGAWRLLAAEYVQPR